ncbi:MAG: hypothetical protein CMM74_09185 [Rhodospirillaceae bacterium]|nr:hypothetical protein [Rhodospirillaceae bacterium]
MSQIIGTLKYRARTNDEDLSRLLSSSLWLIVLTGLMSLHFILIPFLVQEIGFVPAFAPANAAHADAVIGHIPMVMKLQHGLPAFGDAFVRSESSQLIVYPPLPYFLLALVGWPIANRLEALPLIATVLLTPVNASLLYNLAGRITRSQRQAVLAATVGLGFSEFFIFQPWHWVNFRKVVDTLQGPIFFNAMVNPQISFILLCASLIALYRLVFMPGRHAVVLNAVLFGLSFYTYSFLWTYLTGLYTTVGLYFLWRRDFKRLRLLVVSVVVGLLLSALYWADVLQFRQTAGYADFQDRFAIGRRTGLSERLVHLRPHLLTLAGLGLFVIRRNARYMFLFLALLTAELIWKSPVVIGVDFQTLHYAYFVYGPLGSIVCVVVAGEVVHSLRVLNHRRVRIGLGCGTLIGMLLLIGYRTAAYSAIYHPAFAIPPAIQSAYDYIRHHAAAGTVVLAADPEVNMRVRSVAPVYVYVPSGWASFVTNEEMLLREAEALRFYGIDPVRMFASTPGRGLIAIENYLFALSIDYPSQEKRREAILAASSGIKPGALSHPVDIVWQGPYERRFGVDDFAGLPVIYENELVTLYEFGSWGKR